MYILYIEYERLEDTLIVHMGLEGRHVIVIVVYCRYNIEDQYIIFKYSSFHTIIKPVCRSECAHSVYFIGGHIENIHDIIYVIHI